MFLSWITQLVKAAVLRGFHQAIEELELEAADAPDAALEALKGRMTALPAPSSNGEHRPTRKSK